MNLYTTEEVNILLESISNLHGYEKIVLNSKGNVVRYDQFILFAFTDPNLDPFKFTPTNISVDSTAKNLLKDIRKLIYEEPLYRVPLYINIYPDIASWRLALGK
jgi:hypothetical protein